MSPQANILPSALQALSLLTVIGTLACRLVIIPSFPARGDRAAAVRAHDRLTVLSGIALLALTAAAVALLAIRSAVMSEQPLGQLRFVLPVVLEKTHFGAVWLIRAASILALWAGWGMLKITDRNRFAVAMLCAATVTAWTLSAAGHAAGPRDFSLAEWVDWAHVMSGSLWGGSVLATLWALWPSRSAPDHLRLLVKAGRRLSRFAAWAVVAVLASGLGNLFHQLNAAGDLVSTGYGRVLLLKLALVSAMLLVASANRFFLLPSLCSGSQSATSARRFLTALALETALAAAVLGCVGVLNNGPPPPASKATMTGEP